MSQLVSLRREGALAIVTLERPEVMNALSFDTLGRLSDLSEQLGQDPGTRAVIVTGAGGKAFCAGADLKERAGFTPEQTLAFVTRIGEVFTRVAQMPQPTIAAIDGVAYGGGLELALACDLRVAGRNSRMGLTETSLAIIPGAGGTQRLPRLIGKARAKELILTARRIDAAEAERIGLLNRIAPAGRLRETGLEVARAIAANGPVAVRAAKRAIDEGCELALGAGLRVEAACYDLVLPTADRLEALAAFAEKRPPRFVGA